MRRSAWKRFAESDNSSELALVVGLEATDVKTFLSRSELKNSDGETESWTVLRLRSAKLLHLYPISKRFQVVGYFHTLCSSKVRFHIEGVETETESSSGESRRNESRKH